MAPKTEHSALVTASFQQLVNLFLFGQGGGGVSVKFRISSKCKKDLESIDKNSQKSVTIRNGCWYRYSHAKRMKLELYFIPYKKITSKWIKDLTK